jgi:hypothetical protein
MHIFFFDASSDDQEVHGSEFLHYHFASNLKSYCSESPVYRYHQVPVRASVHSGPQVLQSTTTRILARVLHSSLILLVSAQSTYRCTMYNINTVHMFTYLYKYEYSGVPQFRYRFGIIPHVIPYSIFLFILRDLFHLHRSSTIHPPISIQNISFYTSIYRTSLLTNHVDKFI